MQSETVVLCPWGVLLCAAVAGDYRRQWRKRYIQIWVDDVDPRIRYYRDFEV